MALGDRSGNYSALLAQMLAQSQNRPIAHPGGKVLMGGGGRGGGIIDTSTAQQTNIGVDLGAVKNLIGWKTEDEKKKEAYEEAAKMYMIFETQVPDKFKDIIYQQKETQDKLKGLHEMGVPFTWKDPDSGLYKYLPMSEDARNAILKKPQPNEAMILANMAGVPGAREQLISGLTSMQRPTEVEMRERLAPGSTERLLTAEEKLKLAGVEAHKAQAFASTEHGKLFGRTDPNLRGGGGTDIDEKILLKRMEERDNKIKNLLHDHSENVKNITQVKIEEGAAERNHRLTQFNASTVGALRGLQSLNAADQYPQVVGRWLGPVSSELAITPKLSNNYLTPKDQKKYMDLYQTHEDIINTLKNDIPDIWKPQLSANILRLRELLSKTKEYEDAAKKKAMGK